MKAKFTVDYRITISFIFFCLSLAVSYDRLFADTAFVSSYKNNIQTLTTLSLKDAIKYLSKTRGFDLKGTVSTDETIVLNTSSNESTEVILKRILKGYNFVYVHSDKQGTKPLLIIIGKSSRSPSVDVSPPPVYNPSPSEQTSTEIIKTPELKHTSGFRGRNNMQRAIHQSDAATQPQSQNTQSDNVTANVQEGVPSYRLQSNTSANNDATASPKPQPVSANITSVQAPLTANTTTTDSLTPPQIPADEITKIKISDLVPPSVPF